MKILDSITGVGQHQTTIEVTYIYGAIAVRTQWVEDPKLTVYGIYTRSQALQLAWAFIKAALTFGRFE